MPISVCAACERRREMTVIRYLATETWRDGSKDRRDIFGHADLATTEIYARNDNRTKEKVIDELAPKLVDSKNIPDWRKDGDIMDMLR